MEQRWGVERSEVATSSRLVVMCLASLCLVACASGRGPWRDLGGDSDRGDEPYRVECGGDVSIGEAEVVLKDALALCFSDDECISGLVCRPCTDSFEGALSPCYSICWDDGDLEWLCGVCLPPGGGTEPCDENSDCAEGYSCPVGPHERISFYHCVGAVGAVCDLEYPECDGEWGFGQSCERGLHCSAFADGAGRCEGGVPECVEKGGAQQGRYGE